MILGIDEVGRGPWAGPLVVGAVVLGDNVPGGLTDSKKLSPARRKVLEASIKESALSWGLGWVHADELDAVGLSEALVRATRRAVEAIDASYTQIIIDGTVNFLKDTGKGRFVTTMKKADLLIPSVSAASILAKVARDEFMAEQDKKYEGYSFSRHSGYGTAIHATAIKERGLTPLHRRSFAPIAAVAGPGVKVTTTSKGAAAEDVVRGHLESHGFVILKRNWRTKWCEVDIIAAKAGITYFVEFKYRRNQDFGGGIGAITKAKQRQMAFAAELYMSAEARERAHRLVVAVVDVNGALSWFEVE